MKVRVDQIEGKPVLHIEAPLDLAKTSRSGNSTIVATTRGQQFIGNVNGRPTYLQLNVMQMGETQQGSGFELEVDHTATQPPPTTAPGETRGRRAA